MDKRAARRGARRVRERALLSWALAGGAFGLLAAMALLRHKTRKPGFAMAAAALGLLHAALLAGVAGLRT